MNDRGMVKFRPFNSILNSKDIYELINKKDKKVKPSISKDRILKINDNIALSINLHKEINIKYYLNDIIDINGYINKIDTIKKYILINNIKIYFKDIIDVNIL